MRVETSHALKTRRRGRGLITALTTALAVFAVVTALAAGIFLFAPRNGSVAASFIHAQPGSLPWDEREPLTILLMGGSGASAHTNALIVASFSPATRSLELLSIPGNLWVTIPGYGRAEIAEAYSDGGARLALQTVESVTHLPIPYYAFIDPGTATQLVDALGGVSLGSGSRDRRSGAIRHLDGAATLDYVAAHRTESAGSASVMRREQRILLRLRAQALQPQTLLRIPTILNSLGGSIPSNFPYNQIPDLAGMLASVRPSNIHTTVLSQDNNTVTSYVTGGQQVLLPDWYHIRVAAQRLIPADLRHSAVGVEILNGNGIPGQASGLAQWLSQARIRVHGYDSADSFGYAHTEVVMNSVAHPDDRLALSVAALLQAPLVSAAIPKSKASVVVIIGHDFQDPTQQ